MSEVKTYPVPADFAAQANVNAAQYEEMYQRSVNDPAGFWGEQAEQYLSWFGKWDSVLDWSFKQGRPAHQLVQGRQAQRLPQLPGSAPGATRRPGRHHLGGGRPQHRP